MPGTGEAKAGEVFDRKDEDASDFEGSQGGAGGFAEVWQGLDREGDEVEDDQYLNEKFKFTEGNATVCMALYHVPIFAEAIPEASAQKSRRFLGQISSGAE